MKWKLIVGWVRELLDQTVLLTIYFNEINSKPDLMMITKQ